MKNTTKQIIMHIDVNSAFLSWEAADRLKKGDSVDLREVASVVGGDKEKRHGVVLARSIPAKKYGITTGESIYSALRKCNDLVIVPPRQELYAKYSKAMINILEEYSPCVEKYSVDEAFLDYTNMDCHFGDPITAANRIKEHIKQELGFTVNIGISTNKILSKMASDFSKPDKVHTLYPGEIKNKMWSLPVENLFMIGMASLPKLHSLGIYTIGDLANSSKEVIYQQFKKAGIMMWEFANGIDNAPVSGSENEIKSIGNSTTTSLDLTTKDEAYRVILGLVELTTKRLRENNFLTNTVTIEIKNSIFKKYSHQVKLYSSTDSTKQIYNIAKQLFNDVWKGEPIRLLGVRLTGLSDKNIRQQSLFDESIDRNKDLDKTIDAIRNKYGSNSILRASFMQNNLIH